MQRLFLIFITLLFHYSCDDKVRIDQFNAFPEWDERIRVREDNQEVLFVFLYGNPLNHANPTTELKTADAPQKLPSSIKVGGIEAQSKYLETLKEKLSDEVLFLTRGPGNRELIEEETLNRIKGKNQYIENNAVFLTAKDLPQNSGKLKIDHDKREFFEGFPWFNSNIISLSSTKPTTLLGNQTTLSFPLAKSNINLFGVETASQYQDEKHVVGFYFEEGAASLLKNKKEGITALYINSKLNCHQELPLEIISFKDFPSLEKVCDTPAEIGIILKKLPKGSIDIIYSHEPNLSFAQYQGIPIISLFDEKGHIQGTKLVIEDSKINSGESLAFPPIKLCHQVFVGTQDCHLNLNENNFPSESREKIISQRNEKLEKSSYSMIPARFLGKELILSIENH